MWKITKEPKTAQEFIDYLDSIYGKNRTTDKTITGASEIWNAWDQQGISASINKQVASNPYAIYRAYFNDIMQACDIETVDPSTVYFSLIRLKNLNAFANTMPNTDKVIVFDDSLIAFFTSFIITAMQAAYSNPTEEEMQLLEDFLFSILSTFYGKEQNQQENEIYIDQFIKVVQKDYRFTEIGSYFSMAFTIFIICHELSHHILGHSETKRMYLTPSPLKSVTHAEIPLNTPAHQEEFEADKHAYQLFLELIDKIDQIESAKLPQTFNRAPLIFFEIIEIMALFTRTKGFYQQENDTHPEPMERKKYLLLYYNDQLDPEGEELYRGFMKFAEPIKKHLRNLCEIT